ncbi:MAG: substrate-binding domain-containing protein [Bacteroidota bacterium]
MKRQKLTPFFIFNTVWVSFLLLITACGGNTNLKGSDTPTAGRIKVGVEESYQLMVEAEEYTFETFYKYAKIDAVYLNEADVINDFMNDSVPLIIVNRKLSEQQVAYLKERQYIPKTTKIALDAVALIVNNENPDTSLFYQTVKEIFQGKIKSWEQINRKSKLKDIRVVFDNYKSSNPRYFKEKFGLDSLPATCFAAAGNNDVINYVEKNPNAVGVIGVNWISNKEDSLSNKFLHQVKVVGISLEGDNDPGTKFYKPYQAYIAEGSYPFTREVYCINRQTYTGLAYGFSSFIAGEKGQLIILHSGLVPAAMPVRIVEIKH